LESRVTWSLNTKLAAVSGLLCRDDPPFTGGSQMLEFEETLTPEEILLRFKKLFGRDMTSQEMGCFFFPV
jgi:hypothetical protein